MGVWGNTSLKMSLSADLHFNIIIPVEDFHVLALQAQEREAIPADGDKVSGMSILVTIGQFHIWISLNLYQKKGLLINAWAQQPYWKEIAPLP